MSNKVQPIVQVLTAPRRNDETYATLAEIAACPDRLIVDVRLPWWLDRAGRPLVMQVRTPSAEDEHAIACAAAKSTLAECLETLKRGVIRPRIDARSAAELLRTKSPRAIAALVQFIQSLSTMTVAELTESIIASDTLVFDLPESLPDVSFWPAAPTPEHPTVPIVQEPPNNEALILTQRVRAVAA